MWGQRSKFTRDEGLDGVNSKEVEEIDEGGNEENNSGEFRESGWVERGRIVDLVVLVEEEVVGDGEDGE